MAIVYLDNNSTTMVHPDVAQLMADMQVSEYGNHASSHDLGSRSANILRLSRETLGSLFDVDPDHVFFTSGATEGNNLVLRGFVSHQNKEGRVPHILSSAVEHESVLATLVDMMKTGQCTVSLIPVDQSGTIRVNTVERLIRPETSLVCVMLANNETGVVQPVADVADIVKPRGIYLHCDATQVAGKYPIHIPSLGIDSMVGSGHKAHGPKGVGFAYVSPEFQASIDSVMTGGFQEGRRRSGTVNVPGVAAMAYAFARNLLSEENDRVMEREERLRDVLQDSITSLIPTVKVSGKDAKRLPNTLHICIPGLNSRKDVVPALSEKGVMVNSGSACSMGGVSHVLMAMKIPPDEEQGSVRISLSEYTTPQDCSTLVNSLAEILTES